MLYGIVTYSAIRRLQFTHRGITVPGAINASVEPDGPYADSGISVVLCGGRAASTVKVGLELDTALRVTAQQKRGLHRADAQP